MKATVFFMIESLIDPGSYWSKSWETFRAYALSTKYKFHGEAAFTAMNEASKKEPCKVVKVYDKVETEK